MREGLTAYRATGLGLGHPVYSAALTCTYGVAGQSDEGLRVVGEAIVAVQKNGEVFWEAELWRVKGELLLNSERGRQNDE